MPRYAVIDDGVVTGMMNAPSPPTVNIPKGQLYVDVTILPMVTWGTRYDHTTGIFSPGDTEPPPVSEV